MVLNKLFLDLYLAKFLDTSAKLFILYTVLYFYIFYTANKVLEIIFIIIIGLKHVAICNIIFLHHCM